MSILFKGRKCTIGDKNNQVVAIVHEDHGLYKLGSSNVTLDTAPEYSVTQPMTKEQLWHNRLGRLSLNNIKMIFNKNMLFELPKTLASKCLSEACIMGKHHREPFPKGKAWCASQPLQL